MPLTLSHPAAVLPFKRFTPNRLNFAALVIGSMTPDFGYFIGQERLAKIAHHPIGTVAIDIPIGLALLGLFYLLRRDLCYILPSPHRNQLTPLSDQKRTFTVQFLFVATFSILLGAWTHVVWDQFTHNGTYAFRHFALLRAALLHISGQKITVAYSLQYISTALGAAILAIAYIQWIRAQPPRGDNQPDLWRYLLWIGLALVSLAIGNLSALRFSAAIHDLHTFRQFIYNMVIITIAVFTILVVTSAVLCYRRNLAAANL